MCTPPLNCVVFSSCPAFFFREELANAFQRFVSAAADRYDAPANLARYVQTALEFENLSDHFLLVAKETTIAACHENRQVTTIGSQQILFDTLVVVGGRSWHLSVVANCYSLPGLGCCCPSR